MELRSYDPALGRFNGIDPVTHFSQGTSVAFDNNPVYWADPSGADATQYDSKGRVSNYQGRHVSITDRGESSNNSNRGDRTSNNNGTSTETFSSSSTSSSNSGSQVQELPSVEILIWNKTDGMKDVGHTAIRIDGITYGFYPEDYEEAKRLNDTKGYLSVRDVELFEVAYIGDEITSFELNVSSEQKHALLNALKNIEKNPGTYNLRKRQCTSVACEAINKAGINIKKLTLHAERTGIIYTPASMEGHLKWKGNRSIVKSKRTFIVGE